MNFPLLTVSHLGIVEKRVFIRQKLHLLFIVNDEALSRLGRMDQNDSVNMLVSHPVSESKDSLEFVPGLRFIVTLGKKK